MKKTLRIVLMGLLLVMPVLAQVNNAKLDNKVAGQGNNRYYDFNFVGTDVAAVLQALAVTAGIDIVPVPEVIGIKVDLKITKKTWQEALDILCTTYDLTWIIEDKYVSVQRTSTWQAKQLKAAEKKEQSEQVAPLVRKNFQIRHAKASELESVIQSMRSSRGKITVIERNNAIIVYDTEQRIQQMGKALKELDIETQQIVITAKLVVIDSKVARELGVDWSAKAGSGGLTTGSGGRPADGTLFDSRNQVAMQSTPLKGNLTGAGQTITMSLLDNNLGVGIYNLIGDGKGEILASPQISTLDHTEARIFMGDKISIRIIDASGQSATQLVESGIKLTVTPHITGDNRILMDLKPENNSYSYDDKGQPIISTQEAETKVVVADGETVVIGGLTNNVETETETGIPFLKDIPLLGYLFKYYKKEITKKDLIIFVTPRIQRNQFQEAAALAEPVAVEMDAASSRTPSANTQESPQVAPAPETTIPPPPAPAAEPDPAAVPAVPPPSSGAEGEEDWK